MQCTISQSVNKIYLPYSHHRTFILSLKDTGCFYRRLLLDTIENSVVIEKMGLNFSVGLFYCPKIEVYKPHTKQNRCNCNFTIDAKTVLLPHWALLHSITQQNEKNTNCHSFFLHCWGMFLILPFSKGRYFVAIMIMNLWQSLWEDIYTFGPVRLKQRTTFHFGGIGQFKNRNQNNKEKL